LFIASEATPSLDLNIIHGTAHMKGAGIAPSAYQLGYRLTVQSSNPRRKKKFFLHNIQTSFGANPAPLFNVYHQGSFVGEKRLRSEINHHLHLRC
jgi:hypothetical protein